MTTADNVVAGDDDVQAVRRWVRLSCTEPGTHLPALAEIAADLRLSTAVVRAALEQLAAERMVTCTRATGSTASARRLRPSAPTGCCARRSTAATSPARFMTRFGISQRFDIGGKEAAAAVRQLIAEGPRGQYVNAFSPQQQRRRVKQLRERASQLRREVLELMRTAREIEQELPAGGDAQET
ncbi:GntR family transcriptional regulator [Streptomyces sp. NPDC017082]|uniref:GntR family transcriptional regulator n=1 Tax=Streptomyces sp. NPDC017082 TaxID=3364974 RepID=UPI0037908B43